MLMLLTGGMALQEVFYSLAEEDADLSLAESIKVLDEHFVPTANIPFEQHMFRQLEQQVDETIDQYVCRLRQKSLSCDFEKVDEAIRDQLIEKCCDARLRRKFLEKAGNAKLKANAGYRSCIRGGRGADAICERHRTSSAGERGSRKRRPRERK